MKYRRFIAAAAALLTLMTAVSCGKDEVPESDKDKNPTIYSEDTSKSSSQKLDWGDSSQNKPQNNGGQNNGGPNNGQNNMPQQNSGNGGGMPNGNGPQGGNSAPYMGGSGYPSNNNSSNNFWGNSNPNGGNPYSGGQQSVPNWGQSGGGTWGGVQNNYNGGGFSGNTGGNNNQGGENGGGEQNQNTQPNTQPATQAPTAPVNSSEVEAPDDTLKYTAEVTLGSDINVKGSNIKVNGSVVTITSEGDYIFSGSLPNGQICVDTASPTDKVTIVLNGVEISNSNGPAILIDEAKKCTIKVKDGTANYLSDGGDNKIYDGTIFSNDTLRLKGNGELYITANNAHGISCDDDIIVDNGTYNIISAKSGIFVHDDITINGGRVNIKGGTNGIKSKGTININGGCTMISGGFKEEKRSIYAMGTFSYTGGYVFAAGNQVSVPTYSERPYVVMDLVDPVEGGNSVEMVLNDIQMATFVPHTEFRSLMMLAPEISAGNTFYAVINGENTEQYTIEEGLNLFTTK
ncbi:carbohydrate-binding domain-containing protein [Ruminococcus flavefaciens]|uniref:Carbohydrate-binding domain-containing protein n=1 Tax=Ruminococcus flavefaciens TaxID=1265 RepID=A0A1M7J9H8_RUMFL|nr:carbohydrate-binding domain-containing protein [Ruminococcus flavefaciens]SHM49652.1 protein of unknown function [Ruminococcus flavefaciens]